MKNTNEGIDLEYFFHDTDIGGRHYNDDRLGFCMKKDSLILVIADGMGSCSHGGLAAHIICQTLIDCFDSTETVEEVESFFNESIQKAYKNLVQTTIKKKLYDIPKTTFAAVIVQNNNLHTAHAGDSRIIFFDDETLLFQTKDHSKIQTLIDQGLIDEIERNNHPEKNKIYNCIGISVEQVIEHNLVKNIKKNTHLMLSTDGIWQYNSESFIMNLCQKNKKQAGIKIMNNTKEQGGRYRDNASMILCGF